MRIIAEPNNDASAVSVTICHNDGHVSSGTMGISYLTKQLTTAQIKRFFDWSWTSGKSVKDEFIDRVISATTEDERERNWTLTMRFPGVPNPGVMLPDGSSHT